MTSHSDPTVAPVAVRGLVAGACASTAAWMLLGFLDSLHSGDAGMGIFLVLAPAVIPIATSMYTLLGSPIFLLARRASLPRGLNRFLFVMLFLTPLVFAGCAVITVWIDGATGFSGHWNRGDAALITHLREMGANNWRGLLFMVWCGGLACWCADGAPLLWSADRDRRRRARTTACAIAAFTILPPFAFLLFNQYLVAYRSQTMAGERPYCLLVPSYDQRNYETATEYRQLSVWRMQAPYSLVSGSRGGLYDTDHALLVLDGPREYMNWSYHSENFVHDALLNGTTHDGEPRDFKPCEPKRDFVGGLR